jgi:hypothetical protein
MSRTGFWIVADWVKYRMLHAPLEVLTLSGPGAITTVAIGAAAVRVFTDFPIDVTEFTSSILAPTNHW